MCVGSTQPPDKFYLHHTSAVTLLVKINKLYLVGCLMLSLGRWRTSKVEGGGGGDTQIVEKPEARFEFVSLESGSCLPAAHFLSVHHTAAGIGYDIWPPCRHSGSLLLILLHFVSDTLCACRHPCYLSNRRASLVNHFACHPCVSCVQLVNYTFLSLLHARSLSFFYINELQQSISSSNFVCFIN